MRAIDGSSQRTNKLLTRKRHTKNQWQVFCRFYGLHGFHSKKFHSKKFYSKKLHGEMPIARGESQTTNREELMKDWQITIAKERLPKNK